MDKKTEVKKFFTDLLIYVVLITIGALLSEFFKDSPIVIGGILLVFCFAILFILFSSIHKTKKQIEIQTEEKTINMLKKNKTALSIMLFLLFNSIFLLIIAALYVKYRFGQS